MRAAQKRIEQEKTAWLRQLTPEQSLAIYHALWEAAAPHRNFEQPSTIHLAPAKGLSAHAGGSNP
jgi:hypothetical protein